MKAFMVEESNFRGLDLSADAENIGVGFLTTADNVILDGTDLLVRPGKRGQLTTPYGAAIYGLTAYPDAGTSKAFFVSGGKLYKWTMGAASGTEVLDSGSASLSLTSGSVYTARSLNLAYLVDGTSFYRTDLTNAKTALVSGLNTPGSLVTSLYGGELIDDGNTYTNWASMDSATSGECLLNTSFESWTTSVSNPDNWTEYVTGHGWSVGDAAATGNTPSSGTYTCYLQVGKGGRYQRITPETLTNPTGTMTKARHFTLSFKAHSRDANRASTVVVKVSALDASNNDMAIRTFEALPTRLSGTSAVDYIQFSYDVAFTELETDPTSIEVGIFPGLENQDTVLVDEISLKDAAVGLVTVDGATNGFDTVISATITSTSGRSVVITDSGTLAGGSNGLFIQRTLSADTDYSRFAKIKAYIKIAPQALEANPNLTLRLGVQKSSGGVYWSAEGYRLPDGETDVMIFDMESIAVDVRAAVKYLVLQVVGDQYGGVGSSSALFGFFGMYGIGGQAPNAVYWYKLVEFNSNSDSALFDIIESDVSTSSPLVITNDSQSATTITFPARVNSTADYWILVRYGGTLVDAERGKVPLGFVLAAGTWAQATFAVGADTNKGSSPSYAFRANPHISWTKTGSTGDAGSYVIDSTPDAWLATQPLLAEGKEQAPSNPIDVCVWKERVWVCKGGELYGSWKINSSTPSGLYFSRVVLPSDHDPFAELKGWYVKLQLDGAETIQRIIPYGDQLVILTQSSIWIVKGDNPLNFALVRYRGDRTAGLIARRAVTVFSGLLWYLGPDGLYAWDGSKVTWSGKRLKKALYPQSDPNYSPLTVSAVSLSSFVAAGKYLVLIVPTNSSSSAPDVAYVLNTDEKEPLGWTRWTNWGMTGGAGFTSSLDQADLVFAGTDGQLYRMTGLGDKATPAASTTGVAIEIETRAFGDKGHVITPNRLLWNVVNSASATCTLSVEGAVSGANWSSAQTLSAGDNAWWVRASKSARGRSLRANLAVTSTGSIRISKFMLELSRTIWQGS